MKHRATRRRGVRGILHDRTKNAIRDGDAYGIGGLFGFVIGVVSFLTSIIIFLLVRPT